MKWFLLVSILFNIRYVAFSQQDTVISNYVFNNRVDNYYNAYIYNNDLHISAIKSFISHKSFFDHCVTNTMVFNNNKVDLEHFIPFRINYNYIRLYNYSTNSYSNYKSSIPLNFDINSALIFNNSYRTYGNIDSFNPYGASSVVDAIWLGVFNSLLKL